MRLKKIFLENFRAYRDRIDIEIDPNLTALIGQNDVGKSTILEALAIFFGHPSVKPDSLDKCVFSEHDTFTIGAVFSDLPESILIDSTYSTSLAAEYLLNSDGDLEIHKSFKCTVSSPKPKIVAIANHPTSKNTKDLLNKKITDLKKLVEKLGIEKSDINLTRSADLRKAIRNNEEDLELAILEIPLDKDEGKKLWEQIEKHLPYFALFKSDRDSTDQDAEFQDPMKAAVQLALADLEPQLKNIQDEVQKKTEEVAKKTIEKLNELDSTLADQLSPNFKTNPSWGKVFTMALTGDNQIPVNKRGSGVRRLILISFFRAEVERKKKAENSKSVIYAIEEPETSQHPDNQVALITALNDLSEENQCQIMITTHVPSLAGLISKEGIRHLTSLEGGNRSIENGSPEILRRVADDIGVLPDKRVQVLVCVEGPLDVLFLNHVSKLISSSNEDLPNLSEDPRIITIPLGGNTLKDWVSEQYLKNLELPEVHIYDSDDLAKPSYQAQFETINSRKNSKAFQTDKKEFENYFHRSAIKQCINIEIDIDDESDIGESLAKAIHSRSETPYSWENLSKETKKKKISTAKKRMNRECLRALTLDMLRERNAFDEIELWLQAIKSKLN